MENYFTDDDCNTFRGRDPHMVYELKFCKGKNITISSFSVRYIGTMRIYGLYGSEIIRAPISES